MTSEWEDQDADFEAEMAAQECEIEVIGADEAYTLGVQDRVRNLPMRESFTLHVSDQNAYVNGYRDMSSDLGQRERFTTYDQHGFLDSEWQH